MQILFILNGLGLGGAENYTVSLMNSFIDLGHSVELRVLSKDTTLKNKLNSSINLKIWDRKHKIDIDVINKIKKDINNNNYHVIISSSLIYTRLSVFLANSKIFQLYPIHSTIPLSRKYFIINYLFFHSRFKHEVFITSIKSQTNYLISKYSLRKDYFKEINNGIDTHLFCIASKNFNKYDFLTEKGISPSDKIILMVAGFRPEKRHIDAIKAFKLLLAEYPNTKLIFVGNDLFNKKEQIEKFAVGMSDRIFFFTGVSEADLINFYWSADVFTLTSDNETFPISALEAMATGLACVLTNVGGVEDFLFPGINGEIAIVNDPLSIKDAWKEVLFNNNKYDSNEIRQLVVSKYSLESATQNYIDLVKKYGG